jgi:hypothetical protein
MLLLLLLLMMEEQIKDQDVDALDEYPGRVSGKGSGPWTWIAYAATQTSKRRGTCWKGRERRITKRSRRAKALQQDAVVCLYPRQLCCSLFAPTTPSGLHLS